jgi:hypothetical protein
MIKKVKTPIVTKAKLVSQCKEQQERLEWADRIIRMQQAEVDRLMQLTETLTNTLNNFSRKDI